MQQSTEFDPSQYALAPSRFFEDFQIGERFPAPSRTQSDALFLAFQSVSGDNHPIHYDRPYCQARGHRDMLAHGFQVLVQTAPGAGLLPHMLNESLVAFLEQSSRFLAPVYAGDTLYPMLEITALQSNRNTGVIVLHSTVHNQSGVLVMDGEQKLLVRRREPAG